MKWTLALAVLAALGGTALADETCFEVSADGKTWSRTPELLCVGSGKDADYTFSLRTGIPGTQQEVMTLRLSLLNRVRCADCNKDVFGVANPSNSIANAFQVKFDGKRTRQMDESGTVTIGATRLFYRGKAGTSPVPTLPVDKSAPPPVAPPTSPSTKSPADKQHPHQSPPTHAPPPSQ